MYNDIILRIFMQDKLSSYPLIFFIAILVPTVWNIRTSTMSKNTAINITSSLLNGSNRS